MSEFKSIVLYKGKTARTANSSREVQQFMLEGYAPLQPNLEHPRFVYRGVEKLRVENPEEEAAAKKNGFGRVPPHGLSSEQAPAAAVASAVQSQANDLSMLLAESNAREDKMAAQLADALAANKSLGGTVDELNEKLDKLVTANFDLNNQLAEATAPKGKK